MKKAVKITLTVVICALCLFLLLPFLETQAPSKTAPAADKKAEPQIFTSNPLTDIVGRIARFFGAREKAKSVRNAQRHVLTDEQAAEMFGEPQDNTLYAAANGANIPAAENVFQTAEGGAYIDAYLQNDDEEWVLIRQEVPQGASRGMHEINVRDNAYDRFVTQERQARFTPVMRTRKKQEVPESRLARVFNPIKHFFGFGEEPVASGAFQGTEIASAAARRTSASSAMGKNKEKSSILPKANPVDWEGFKNNPFSSMVAGGREAAEALLNLINPSARIDDLASWLADAKYPQTDSPEQQNEKEQFQNRWSAEKKQQVNREMQELMVRRNAGQDPVNVLEGTLGCGDGSVSKQACSREPEQPAQQQDISGIKELSSRQFFEKTGLRLPPAGITVVLNSSDMPVADEDFMEYAEEDKKQTAEFYSFMQQQCQDNCYWVATGADNSSDLAQTIEAVGLTLKGDPLNRYDQYAQAYLADKKAQGSSEEEIQELQTRLEEHKTPFITYSQSELNQMFRENLELLKKAARPDGQVRPEDGSVPFFTHVQNAYDFHQRTDCQFPIFYGQGSAVDGDKKLEERAEALTDELAQFINDTKGIVQKVEQESAREGTKAMVKPALKQIQDQLKNDLANFNKTNDLGKTQK